MLEIVLYLWSKQSSVLSWHCCFWDWYRLRYLWEFERFFHDLKREISRNKNKWYYFRQRVLFWSSKVTFFDSTMERRILNFPRIGFGSRFWIYIGTILNEQFDNRFKAWNKLNYLEIYCIFQFHCLRWRALNIKYTQKRPLYAEIWSALNPSSLWILASAPFLTRISTIFSRP